MRRTLAGAPSARRLISPPMTKSWLRLDALKWSAKRAALRVGASTPVRAEYALLAHQDRLGKFQRLQHTLMDSIGCGA